jgi:hypothetical protein
MNGIVDTWVKKIGEFVGEIAADDALSDTEYIEVLEEMVDIAQSSIDAKKAEMNEDAETDSGAGSEEGS